MNNGARKPRVYGLAYASLNYYYHFCTKVVGRGTAIAARGTSRRSPIVKSFRFDASPRPYPRVDQDSTNFFLFSFFFFFYHSLFPSFYERRPRARFKIVKKRKERFREIYKFERWKGSMNIENSVVITRRVIAKFWKVLHPEINLSPSVRNFQSVIFSKID